MVNKNILMVLVGLVLVITISAFVFSETQHLIPIQGKAEDISGNLLATGNISVRIYESQTDGIQTYSNVFSNAINNGIYDIQLSLSLNNTKKYYLELDINGEEVVGDANGGREEFYPGGGDHTHTHLGLWNPITSNKITYNAANVGIGVTEPMEKLHIGDGHVLIEGGGETQLIFKRDFKTINGPSGNSTNPMFKFGRIIQAGDGDPEVRVLYSDDEMAAEGNYDGRTVFEFDRKGIVASVKPSVGSHFEGFISNMSTPTFRLNSWPSMQLEMGAGNGSESDVAIRRSSTNKMSFITGRTDGLASEKMVIDGNGNVGIGTLSPSEKLDVSGGGRFSGVLNTDGGLKLKNSGSAPVLCNSTNKGHTYFDTTENFFKGCDGTKWIILNGHTIVGYNYTTNMNDRRTGSTSWTDIPDRVLGISKKYNTSYLKISYSDNLGSYPGHYNTCVWRIVLDNNPVMIIKGGIDTSSGWYMWHATHTTIAAPTAGSHIIKMQFIQNSGSGEGCMAGYDSSGNLFMVEEII